jgi:hypothetical protein
VGFGGGEQFLQGREAREDWGSLNGSAGPRRCGEPMPVHVWPQDAGRQAREAARGFRFDALGIRMMPGRCPNRDRRQHESEGHQSQKSPDDDFEAGQFGPGALGEGAFKC